VQPEGGASATGTFPVIAALKAPMIWVDPPGMLTLIGTVRSTVVQTV
jgi:hypothetical protein